MKRLMISTFIKISGGYSDEGIDQVHSSVFS